MSHQSSGALLGYRSDEVPFQSALSLRQGRDEDAKRPVSPLTKINESKGERGREEKKSEPICTC